MQRATAKLVTVAGSSFVPWWYVQDFRQNVCQELNCLDTTVAQIQLVRCDLVKDPDVICIVLGVSEFLKMDITLKLKIASFVNEFFSLQSFSASHLLQRSRVELTNFGALLVGMNLLHHCVRH